MSQSTKAMALFGLVFVCFSATAGVIGQQYIISDLHLTNQDLGKKGIDLLIKAELSDFNKAAKAKKAKTAPASSDLASAELFLRNNAPLFHYVYGKYDCLRQKSEDINYNAFVKKISAADLQILQSKKEDVARTIGKSNLCQGNTHLVFYAYGSNFGRFDSLVGSQNREAKAFVSNWLNIPTMQISPFEADQAEASLTTLYQLTSRKIQVAIEGFNLKARKPSSDFFFSKKPSLDVAKHKPNQKKLKSPKASVAHVYFKSKKRTSHLATVLVKKTKAHKPNAKSKLQASAASISAGKKQKSASIKL